MSSRVNRLLLNHDRSASSVMALDPDGTWVLVGLERHVVIIVPQRQGRRVGHGERLLLVLQVLAPASTKHRGCHVLVVLGRSRCSRGF